MIDGELLNSLQSSGIIDGYEYTLRRLIEANLPRENVYEKCAYFLLEYQKLILDNNIRAKGLQDFIDLSEPPKKIEPAKPIKEVVPNFPITLKSKLLYEKENNSDDLKVYYKIEFLYFKKRWDVLVYNVDFFFYFKLMIRCLSHLNI